MLDALNNLAVIQHGISTLINNNKVNILTDIDHRIEFNINESDAVIRLFVIDRPDKIVIKTSLYIKSKDIIVDSSETTIPIKNKKPDNRNQLLYVKSFSNFLKSLK